MMNGVGDNYETVEMEVEDLDEIESCLQQNIVQSALDGESPQPKDEGMHCACTKSLLNNNQLYFANLK